MTVVGASTSTTLATSLTRTGLARTSAECLLLVLQRLGLRPLLRRLLRLVLGGRQLLVDLLDAVLDLADARIELLDAGLGLGHGGGQLRDLLRPLLLRLLRRQHLRRHRDGWHRRIRRRRRGRRGLQLAQLPLGAGELILRVVELAPGVGQAVLQLRPLLAQLSLLVGRGLVGLALLLVGERLLLVREPVGGRLSAPSAAAAG